MKQCPCHRKLVTKFLKRHLQSSTSSSKLKVNPCLAKLELFCKVWAVYLTGDPFEFRCVRWAVQWFSYQSWNQTYQNHFRRWLPLNLLRNYTISITWFLWGINLQHWLLTFSTCEHVALPNYDEYTLFMSVTVDVQYAERNALCPGIYVCRGALNRRQLFAPPPLYEHRWVYRTFMQANCPLPVMLTQHAMSCIIAQEVKLIFWHAQVKVLGSYNKLEAVYLVTMNSPYF